MSYKEIDVGELYKFLKQRDEIRKWRKKHKDKNQIDLYESIRKAENDVVRDIRKEKKTV